MIIVRTTRRRMMESVLLDSIGHTRVEQEGRGLATAVFQVGDQPQLSRLRMLVQPDDLQRVRLERLRDAEQVVRAVTDAARRQVP
jgi:hypothetical protein